MQTIRFKNPIPETDFAPQWNFTIGVWNFLDSDNLKIIREFLISKEADILDLPSNGDAGTGVDDNSITTRFGSYNLFDFVDQCPELDILLDWLRTSYMEFIQHESSEICECEIVCWYNILRDGEGMDEHIHNDTNNAYLSGNIQMSEFDTQTNYRSPMSDENVQINGPSGQLIMFPSFVPHGVNHEYQGERISIAFDLYPTHLINDNGGSHKKFIDADIFKRLTS